MNFQELIYSNIRTKKTCFHFLLICCSQISPNHRIFWVGRCSLGSTEVQLLKILIFHLSLPENRIRLLSPCGGSLDSLASIAAPWVCAECPCFQQACGGEVMALAVGRTLGFGCQWQSLLCRAAAEPFRAEFTGGEGSVHHRHWRALLSGQCKACLLNRSGKLGWLLCTLSVHCN